MKQLLLNSAFALIALLLSLNLTAQEDEDKKQTELGFTTNSLTDLDNFNIELKRGRDNRYMRYSLLLLNGYTSMYDPNANESQSITNAGIGLGIGLERRKELRPRLQFLHGPSFTISGSYNKESNDIPTQDRTVESIMGSAYLGWRLGMLYSFSEHFYCSAEIIPSLRYSLFYTHEIINDLGSVTDRTTVRQVPGFSISNGGLRLGLFYRF